VVTPSAPQKSPAKLIKFLLIGLILIGIAAAAFYFITNRTSEPKQITLTYWGLWEPESVMSPILREYEASHPNIKIDYQMQSHQEYRERLQTALTKGSGPDIFRIHNTWVPMFKTHLSSIPPEVYSSSDFDSTFYPTAKNDLRVGSTYVGIPLEFDGLAMFVNEQLLTNSGQSVPQNWDDLYTVASAMAQCESEDGTCTKGGRILIAGAAMGGTDNVDHWQDIVSILMLQNRVNLANPKLPKANAAQDVVDYYNSFSKSIHVWDTSLPSSTDQFASGKLGIYFAPSWRIFDIQAINKDLKFKVYPLPQVALDESRNEKPITWATYWAETVNKKSPYAKESWELLKYLSSPEILTQMHKNAVGPERSFGEPYGRKDLSAELTDSPFMGAFISQAPSAQSWYLASFTHDGPSGINTRLSESFSKFVNGTASIDILAQEVGKTLSDYGITSVPPVGN